METLRAVSRRGIGDFSICSSCLQALRQKSSPRHWQSTQVRRKGYIAKPGEQANRLVGFYAEILETSMAKSHPAPVKRTKIPAPLHNRAGTISTENAADDVRAKAQLVFGSKLAGPTAHRAEKVRKSTNVAGILVPPKPEEPDNCCMSGCVNCVWDVFREDLEEWAVKANEAREALKAQGKIGTADEKRLMSFSGSGSSGAGLAGGAASMDDDGGGSESNWTEDTANMSPPKPGEDMFANIPVGIREFMRTEKMLKLKHAEEVKVGG